ncbi:MAG: hypothetical protein IPO21_02300 [Bacteroidales bacterium]|nr:hypothetical protein [Bacteroidales bacterium]
MTLYLLLCVFAILLTLIALGLTIGGLIKKKRSLWIGSLIAFVFLTLFSVFSIVTYVKKSIDYMGSEEFQEETKKSASNWGKNIGNTVSGAAEGLEATLDDKAIAKLAEKSGVILGSGVKAISTGVEETLGKQTVYTDKEIEALGISIGRAEWIVDSAKYTLGLYLDFGKDINGTLKLTAFDRDGKKVDNSEIVTSQKSGQSKVFTFPFEFLKPTQFEYFVLSAQVK